MVNYNGQDKFNKEKALSRIRFGRGDDAILLDVELNELQKIFQYRDELILKSVTRDGFVNKTAMTLTSGKLTVPPDIAVIQGKIIEIQENMEISGLTTGNKVYLSVWEEDVSFNTTIKKGGNESGGTTISNADIVEPEIGAETSKRVQQKVALSTSNTDTSRTYYLIATLTSATAFTDNRSKLIFNGEVLATTVIEDASHRFMTDAERSKLNGIETGANKYTHPATHPATMIVEDTGHRFMTDVERNKLAGVEANANNYTHPASHPPSIITQDENNRFMTDAERLKLDGVETGANKYIHPATHPATMIVEDTGHRFMTDAERQKLNGISAGANAYTHPATHPASMIVQDASNRFFTDAERTKLEGIQAGANNYTHPSTHPASMIVQDANNRFFTDAERNKLAGFEVVTTASPNKVLKLDANSKLPASITGDADGNSGTATKLQTARNIALAGDVTGSASFDGSANSSITATLKNSGASAGTYPKVTVNAKGLVTGGSSLVPADIPNLDYSKITTGKPTTLAELGIEDIGQTTRISSTLPSTTGWFRIAQSKTDIQRNGGLFNIEWSLSGVHGIVTLLASTMYGIDPTINQLSHSTYERGTGITHARIVYASSYQGGMAYLEVHNAGYPVSLKVELSHNSGWSLITPVAGSIPTNYYAHNVAFDDGIVTDGQLVSTLATGTAPIKVNSTTVVTNLNADTVDGSHAGTGANNVLKLDGSGKASPDIIAEDSSHRFMTDAERTKLSGVQAGATNTTNNAENGAITVNGTKQVVYTHPTTHPASIIVQDSNNRFMTDAERTKLNGIATGANAYTHPSTHPATMITEDSGHRFVTDAEKSTWDAKETTSGAQTKANTAESNAKTHADNLTGNRIVDNRAVVPKPNDYPSNRTTNEFKSSTAVGLNTLGAGTYVHVFTERAWADASGGYVHQMAYDGTTNRTWVRTGNQTDNTWNAWSEIETTSGSQAKVDAHANNSDIHFTSAERTKLSGIATGANNYVHPSTHPASIIVQDANNRFMTDAERTKLSGIAAGANAYTHPATHPPSIIVQDANNRFMTDAERTKLSGIQTGATNTTNHADNGAITVNGTKQQVYTHPTGAGNNHIPTGGTAGQMLVNGGSGVAVWQNEEVDAHVYYADDTGTANAKVMTITHGATAYTKGMCISFVNLVQNTGAVTVNVNGWGTKNLLDSKGRGFTAGKLLAGIPYTFRYNGTSFILQGEGGEYGTAIASDVLAGKTIGTDDGLVTGTMPNRGNLGTLTPGTANRNFSSGYYPTDFTVAGDPDLVTANIKAGANIFGVAGKSSVVETSDATAIASNMESGKTAYVNGAKVTGNLVNRGAGGTVTPSTANQTKSAGIYTSDITIAGDTDLIPANILKGKNIFGVTGTVEARDYANGSLTPSSGADWRQFKNAYGNMVNLNYVTIPISAIGFNPSIVILYPMVPSSVGPTVWSKNYLAQYGSHLINTVFPSGDTLGFNIDITNNILYLPAGSTGITFQWQAYR